jgi:hypothetical protein
MSKPSDEDYMRMAREITNRDRSQHRKPDSKGAAPTTASEPPQTPPAAPPPKLATAWDRQTKIFVCALTLAAIIGSHSGDAGRTETG